MLCFGDGQVPRKAGGGEGMGPLRPVGRQGGAFVLGHSHTGNSSLHAGTGIRAEGRELLLLPGVNGHPEVA